MGEPALRVPALTEWRDESRPGAVVWRRYWIGADGLCAAVVNDIASVRPGTGAAAPKPAPYFPVHLGPGFLWSAAHPLPGQVRDGEADTLGEAKSEADAALFLFLTTKPPEVPHA